MLSDALAELWKTPTCSNICNWRNDVEEAFGKNKAPCLHRISLS